MSCSDLFSDMKSENYTLDDCIIAAREALSTPSHFVIKVSASISNTNLNALKFCYKFQEIRKKS